MQVPFTSTTAYRLGLPLLLCAGLAACGGSDTQRAVRAATYSTRCGLPEPSSETYRVNPPTGASCVGSATAFALDPARKDSYAPDPASQRAVQLRAWYPASKPGQVTRAPYASELVYEALPWPDPQHKPNGNALLNAPVASGAKYPVLLFSPGNGLPVDVYAGMAEDLASHGYIVVAIEHPYITGPVQFPDGHVALGTDEDTEAGLERRAAVMGADQRFALTWLEQHQTDRSLPFAAAMDLARVGAYGHSIGGAAALQTLRADSRIKSAVNMDGTMWGDLTQPWTKPWMILASDRGADSTYDIFRNHPRSDSSLVVMKNS
ncbi:MAG: alpha/beta hydrolase family protein, partial [Gammaproteobacteria bacterium]